MISNPWSTQLKDNPDQLWTGDYSLLNLGNRNSNEGSHIVRWYKTRNELIDAMIKRLEEEKDV